MDYRVVATGLEFPEGPLELPGGASASYPVASCPCDDRNLQFHVRRRAGDAFAARVFEGLGGADTVRIEGPRGGFVLNEESSRPLVFIAGEAGFAPIKSLIEHAMALDHAETLRLYWHSDRPGGHYLANLCRSWAGALDNFHYTALSGVDGGADALARRVLEDCVRLGDFDAYVAGPAQLTNAAERMLPERGLARTQLFLNTLE